jgi:hypothetical protein
MNLSPEAKAARGCVILILGSLAAIGVLGVFCGAAYWVFSAGWGVINK